MPYSNIKFLFSTDREQASQIKKKNSGYTAKAFFFQNKSKLLCDCFTMSFSSDEVNFLVYRYLQESGKSDEFRSSFNLVKYHRVHLWCHWVSIMISLWKRVSLVLLKFDFNRFPALSLHFRHRIPHISVEYQWGPCSTRSSPVNHSERLTVHRSWNQCWWRKYYCP